MKHRCMQGMVDRVDKNYGNDHLFEPVGLGNELFLVQWSSQEASSR